MSAHALLNLLNELRKTIKSRAMSIINSIIQEHECLLSYLSLFIICH